MTDINGISKEMFINANMVDGAPTSNELKNSFGPNTSKKTYKIYVKNMMLNLNLFKNYEAHTRANSSYAKKVKIMLFVFSVLKNFMIGIKNMMVLVLAAIAV